MFAAMTATQAWTEVGGRFATLRRRTAARLHEARARVEGEFARRVERKLAERIDRKFAGRVERELAERVVGPARRARARLRRDARRGLDRALGTVREALDVPARADIERLGRRLDSLRQRLEAIGRDKMNGGRRKR